MVQVDSNHGQNDAPDEVANLEDHAPRASILVVEYLDQLAVLLQKHFIRRKSLEVRPQIKQKKAKDVRCLHYEADPEDVRDEHPVCDHPRRVEYLILEQNADHDLDERGMGEENKLLPEEYVVHVVDQVSGPGELELEEPQDQKNWVEGEVEQEYEEHEAKVHR